MEIKTIKEIKSFEYIEKKSKFISFIFGVDSEKEIQERLDEFKEKYSDATHICYAYILKNESIMYKASDDGEPSSTAGAPILNVLMKNNLVNSMIVVIRYFGGIKLGAGGLTRAYSNSASEVLKKASIVTLTSGVKFKVKIDYNHANDVKMIIKRSNLNIIKEYYDLSVKYELIIENKELIDILNNKIAYLGASIVDIEDIMIRK